MKNHARAGFSLFELAIVLIVMGLVLGAAMPSLLRYRQQASLRETKERQELVAQAVASYLVMTGELPGPADPSKKGESETVTEPNKAVGIVPYRTLGLTESQAKDGFGRYMTYAIPVFIDSLPSPNGTNKFCGKSPRSPITLKVKGEAIYPQNHDRSQDFVALVLISHGPNGQGAFTGERTERIPSDSMSPEEKVNCSGTIVFHDQPYGADNSSKPFRQIVKWVTARNLMGIYGKSPCKEPSAAPQQNNAIQPPAFNHPLAERGKK